MRTECGEQSATALDVVGVRVRIEVEYVVLDVGHRASVSGEVSASSHPERVRCGCAVERLGRGGSPIDEHLVLVIIRQADATDVTRFLCGEVHPAEDEAVVSRAESSDALCVHRVERIALGQRPWVSGGRAPANAVLAFERATQVGIEEGVAKINGALLGRELGHGEIGSGGSPGRPGRRLGSQGWRPGADRLSCRVVGAQGSPSG